MSSSNWTAAVGIKCKTCRYFDGFGVPEAQYGQCHRLPPRPALVVEVEGSSTETPWPSVWEFDFCAEWISLTNGETFASVHASTLEEE